MSKVIMFCFAGRRQNIELQLPYIRRILAQNPDVEYHLWNLARDHDDDVYLRTIAGERITVINDYSGPQPWRRFDAVYRHYANQAYADRLFIKLDDDVVFVETDRFAEFVDTIENTPGTVVTAKVVNNGACTASEPGLWQGFTEMSIPLLDVHLHARYAMMAHQYFFDHWSAMTSPGRPYSTRPVTDWLSINFIGYDWTMARRFADLLGQPSPRRIAGRPFKPHARLGDEGMVNTLPRLMVESFVVCHLTFGPQAKRLTVAQTNQLYRGYDEIVAKYLGVL